VGGIENADAISTASWTSASLAPAARARGDVGGGQLEAVPADRPGDVEQGLHLGVEALGRALLDLVDQRLTSAA
jgi:hypothetical protein